MHLWLVCSLPCIGQRLPVAVFYMSIIYLLQICPCTGLSRNINSLKHWVIKMSHMIMIFVMYCNIIVILIYLLSYQLFIIY
jgi:hypothetical protein